MVLPAARALKVVVAELAPPLIVTGETEMVPTVVLELVTLTFAEVPPAMFSTSTKFSDEFRRAGETVMVEVRPWDVGNVEVPIPPGPAITKPDGARVATAEPLL